MSNVNKHLKNFLPPPEILEEQLRKRFFVLIYLVTGAGFLLGAGIIYLCDSFLDFRTFFSQSTIQNGNAVLVILFFPILVFAVFHFRYRKKEMAWLITFFLLLCILLAFYTTFIFQLMNVHYLVFIFLIEAVMFSLNGIAAHFLDIDLSKKIPSIMTFILGITVAFLTNYFFYHGFVCTFLSFLFVIMIEYFSINRDRLKKILEIKNPVDLQFDQRVMVGAFTISFAFLKRMWTPKTFGKVHVENRWFTHFED